MDKQKERNKMTRIVIQQPKRRCSNCDSTAVYFRYKADDFLNAYFECQLCKGNQTYFKESEKTKHSQY